jgi:hypothetical protein
MPSIQKYLIVHKTNIMLHFPGIGQIGSDNEELYCNSSRRGGKVMGGFKKYK